MGGLHNGWAPWVATGKHLCGAATDFTLRCCAASMQNKSSRLCQPTHLTDSGMVQPAAADTMQSTHSTADHAAEHCSDGTSQKPGAMCAQPATAASDRGSEDVCSSGFEQCGPHGAGHPADCSNGHAHSLLEAGVQGLAVATCCHHRCSWQHFVGKPLFRQLGFSPDDFELISWMTGVTSTFTHKLL